MNDDSERLRQERMTTGLVSTGGVLFCNWLAYGIVEQMAMSQGIPLSLVNHFLPILSGVSTLLGLACVAIYLKWEIR